MDPTPRAPDRWLLFVGIALLVEAAVGFLPAVRDAGPGELSQFVQSACAAAAGGATLMAARRRASPEILRAFLWIAFIALGGLKVSVYLSYGFDSVLRNSSILLSNASWSMLGFGAPILWAAALARTDNPGDAVTQKVGRIAGGLIQLGFVLLFASEATTWATFMRFRGTGLMPFGGYGFWQAIQVADRVLLLWASIESVRTDADEETLRQRAARIHRLMGWWLLTSLVAAGAGQIIIAVSPGGTYGSITFPKIQQVLLRIVLFKTMAVAAMLALYLHFASARKREPVVA